MNKQKSQSGFAHLIIVIIILAIGLIGSLGYIYWHNFMQPKKDDNTSQTKQKPTSKNNTDDNKAVDETASWTKLDTDYFTMPIPDGWKLTKITMADTGKSNISIDKYGLSAVQALTYKAGDRAEVDNSVESGGHGLGGHSLYIDYVGKNVDCATSGPDSTYTKVSDMKADNGSVISKYQKTYETLPDTMVEAPRIVVGTIEYYYSFETNTGCGNVTYFVAPSGQSNNAVQLEQALKAVTNK